MPSPRKPGSWRWAMCRLRGREPSRRYGSMMNSFGGEYSSQSPTSRLFAFDRLEQGLEVPLAEAARAVALDHLEEQGRAVLDRLGEDLQKVALVVAVHEDSQLGQVVQVLVDLADAGRQHVVVVLRHPQERHVVRPHRPDGLNDVPGRHGDVLDAGAAVELQVL